jgi:8-oxo-dGTP pyrophosphatase MutT (NUDIX family)
LKLLKIEKVHNGKYLKNYVLTYENKAGKEKKYEIVSRKELESPADLGQKVSGVSIVAVQNDKMLLLKEFRMGVGRFIYNLCAGMIEEDESLEECIRRELYEETGATKYTLSPICVYSVIGKNRVNQTGEETYGMLFFADIQAFESDLHSEMECVRFFDELPTEWTYPLIQPLLIKEYLMRKQGDKNDRLQCNSSI